MSKGRIYIFMFITFTILVFSPIVISSPVQSINTCPSKPYPVSNFFTRGLQGIFGLNYAVSKTAEIKIKNQLEKLFNQSEISLDIKPYSALDLVAGKAKGAKFSARNITFDGFSVSSLYLESLCDFIYIDYEKDPIEPLAPVFLQLRGTITETDLNKTFSLEKYQDILKGIKVNVNQASFVRFSLLNPKFDVSNGKIFLMADLHFDDTPRFLKLPVKLETGIKVENDKIKLDNPQISSKIFGDGVKLFVDTLKNKNFVAYDIDELEKDGAEWMIKSIIIKDNKINIDGTVWLPAKNQKLALH